jgi:predicted signal transduction protein with EAL and GGDEF domain
LLGIALNVALVTAVMIRVLLPSLRGFADLMPSPASLAA